MSTQTVQLENFCFNAVIVTMANLRRDANYAAFGELLRRFRPSLQLSGQEAQKYIHDFQVTEEAMTLVALAIVLMYLRVFFLIN